MNTYEFTVTQAHYDRVTKKVKNDHRWKTGVMTKDQCYYNWDCEFVDYDLPNQEELVEHVESFEIDNQYPPEKVREEVTATNPDYTKHFMEWDNKVARGDGTIKIGSKAQKRMIKNPKIGIRAINLHRKSKGWIKGNYKRLEVGEKYTYDITDYISSKEILSNLENGRYKVEEFQ